MSGSSTAVASSSRMAASNQQSQRLECPFCQFHDKSEYVLLLHIEALHTDDSPFVVKDDPANTGLTSGFTNSINDLGPGKFNALDYEFGGPSQDDDETTYVLCPEPGCEEPVLLMELQVHLHFHDAEQISMEDVRYSGEGRNASSGSSGSSSGGSSGNSPLGGSGGLREMEMVDRRMDSMERDRGGRGMRDEREGSRSSGGRKEKRENRTLMISRDGVISRESLASRDGHKDRDFQREMDRMLERERERDRDRGREKDRGRDSRGYRLAYPDSGSSSSASSAMSPRHLHRSPKRSYRTFYEAPPSDKDLSSSRRYEKSSGRSNASYKDSGVKRLGVCEVAFPIFLYASYIDSLIRCVSIAQHTNLLV